MHKKTIAKILLIGFVVLMISPWLAMDFVHADVEEVETETQQINKTEPTDGKDNQADGGGSDDVPWYERAWNKIKEIGSDGLELIEDIGRSIEEGLNEFGEWAADAWDATTEWAADAWDTAQDWAVSAWEWIQENEWFQTIVAAVIATAAIVVAAVVIGVSAPIWITIAVVGGLALAGGFLYQWLAGDNYSFWGALGSSLAGGLLGLASVSGHLAAAFIWLKQTGGPAALTWLRGTAWPWIAGKGRMAWGWMKGTAWPWVRGKGVAIKNWWTTKAWPWMSGKARTVGTKIKGFFTTYKTKFINTYTKVNPNWKRNIWLGPFLGMGGGAVSTFVSGAMNGWQFNKWDAIIDIGIGGISGLILGPFVLTGDLLKLSTLLGLTLYGGVESYIADGLKAGEWGTPINFFIGSGMSFFSTISIGVIFDTIFKIPEISTVFTKATEEFFKIEVKDSLTNGGQGGNTGDGSSNNGPNSDTGNGSSNSESNTKGNEPSNSGSNTDKGNEPSNNRTNTDTGNNSSNTESNANSESSSNTNSETDSSVQHEGNTAEEGQAQTESNPDNSEQNETDRTESDVELQQKGRITGPQPIY